MYSTKAESVDCAVHSSDTSVILSTINELLTRLKAVMSEYVKHN